MFQSYTGFPRVLNALEVCQQVFEERGVIADLKEEYGVKVCVTVVSGSRFIFQSQYRKS